MLSSNERKAQWVECRTNNPMIASSTRTGGKLLSKTLENVFQCSNRKLEVSD